MAMCAIANLMGVATATLGIPGLQWIDINRVDSIAFGQLFASEPPRDYRLALCEQGSLADGQYACTDNLYAASVDELVEAAVTTERQFQGATDVVVSGPIRWVASRQLLRDFSTDLVNYHVATSSDVPYGNRETYPDSRRFNQSLQVQLQRVGPTVGFTGTCWFHRAPAAIDVSDNQQIRCYTGLSENDVTKCIRWGFGWEDNSPPSADAASFTIQHSSASLLNLGVSAYTTPQARYLPWPYSSYIEDESCDWNSLFSQPADSMYRNISASQQTYEYIMPGFTNDSIWCDNTAFLSFAAYAMNPSRVSNLLQLVQLGVLLGDPGSADNNAATISLHLSWTLAAWSANGTGDIVPGTRGSAARIIEAFKQFTFDPSQEALQFRLIHQYVLMQAVSLIPYTTTVVDPTSPPDFESANPYTSARLTSWATIQLWKFGIDSRTKVLGAVVLIIGMVIVLLTTVLWFERPKSPTEIVVGALMHDPPRGLLKDEESGAPLTARFKYPGLEEKEETATAVATATGDDVRGQTVRPKKYRRSSSFGFSHPASPATAGSPLPSPGAGSSTGGIASDGGA